MELEKVFKKNYRKICLEFTEERLDSRLAGIETAVEQISTVEEQMELVKLHFEIKCDENVKESFVNAFYSNDKTFDEENEKEISILAGCVLFDLIQENEDIQLAYAVSILDRYYDSKVPELSSAAFETINAQTKDATRLSSCSDIVWEEDWTNELIDATGKAPSSAPQATVEIFKNIKSQFSKLTDYANSLLKENTRCEEKINVLSWVVGEWSNLLQKPLNEIKDVEGALIVAMELAELVSMPGPYAAKGFLNKMLARCETTASELSLTDLIDSQNEGFRQYIVEQYGEGSETMNLLIVSAIKLSLSVDEKKAWVPAYRKLWKINPDEFVFSLNEWSYLVYLECMIGKQ